jgi:hypothetical protein
MARDQDMVAAVRTMPPAAQHATVVKAVLELWQLKPLETCLSYTEVSTAMHCTAK